MGENSRKVIICIVNDSNSYNSDTSIRPYSPDLDLDSNLEEQAYQELVDRMDRGRRK